LAGRLQSLRLTRHRKHAPKWAQTRRGAKTGNKSIQKSTSSPLYSETKPCWRKRRDKVDFPVGR